MRQPSFEGGGSFAGGVGEALAGRMFAGCIQAEGSDVAYRRYTTLTVRRSFRRRIASESMNTDGVDGHLDEDIVAEIQSLIGKEDRRVTPRFKNALRLALRIASFLTITMTPAAINSLRPGILGIWLAPKWSPLLVPTVLCSAVENLGQTLSKVIHAFTGVVIAVIGAYILAHHCQDGSSQTAMIYFMIFTWMVLWIDVDMNVRIFALNWTVFFTMTFANPDVTLEPVMAMDWQSGMMCILFVTFLGCFSAVMCMLFPTPIMATHSAKIHAARTAKQTARLFCFVTDYYCGEEQNISVNIWRTEVSTLRQEIAGMASHLQAAWWEGFDIGIRGVVRELLTRHLDLLKKIDDRLYGLKLCVIREEFSQAHIKAVNPVRKILMETACSAGDLLMAATVGAADGTFNESEHESLALRLQAVQSNIEELASTWHHVRSGKGRADHGKVSALDPDLLTESFFIFEVSAYARLVCDFARDMLDRPPKSQSKLGVAFVESMRSAVDAKTLWESQHLNFTLRSFISLSTAFYFGCYINNFDPQVPQFMCFMLSKDMGAALKTNLGRVQGTVLGMLFGHLLFSELHKCDAHVSTARFVVLWIFEVIAVFINKFSSEYGFIGLLLAIFGGKSLAGACKDHIDEEQHLMNIQLTYASFKAVAIALGIILVVDMSLRSEQASVMARRHFFISVDKMIFSFRAFLEGRPEQVDKFYDVLLKASHLGDEANQEPRWHRSPFKYQLFKNLCHTMESLHLDLETLRCAFEGADSEPDDLFQRVVECSPGQFQRVRSDILETLEDMKALTKAVLEHETPQPLDPQVLKDLQQKKNIEKLDGLEELLIEVQKASQDQLTKAAPKTMEDDELCRLCVVFEMLSSMIEHVAKALHFTVESI